MSRSERLVELRNKQKLKLRDVAKMDVGVEFTQLSKYEKAKYDEKEIKPPVLKRLAEIYKTTTDYIEYGPSPVLINEPADNKDGQGDFLAFAFTLIKSKHESMNSKLKKPNSHAQVGNKDVQQEVRKAKTQVKDILKAAISLLEDLDALPGGNFKRVYQ